jgi:nitrite reductase (NADH) large subunit
MSNIKSDAWICEVCGYIHRGSEPPDECPVCGVGKEFFEPYEEPGKAEPVSKPKRWRCLVCNYEHTGDQPPDECPVCGALADAFEALSEIGKKDVLETSESDHIVIAGSGIAGISAIEAIRKISTDIRITLLSKEKHIPYHRLNLTRYLAAELSQDKLPFYAEDWYRENNVDLVTGAAVYKISPAKKEVSLADGTSYSYDKLILAAGAHPFVPPILGVQREGVTTLRDLDDANYILREAKTAKAVVVIGGGILGLEAAGALARTSTKPVLLENFEWVMPRQLNRAAAELLQEHIKGMGISLRLDTVVRELVGDERVAGVLLDNGETIHADLVIISTGIRPNSYLARMAGLRINQGIVVNDYLQTTDPDIFAAGDIVEHRGQLSGLWNAAQYQGSIAGMNAAGKKVEFGGIPRATTIKVLGVDLLSIGKFNPDDGSDIVIEEKKGKQYSRFLFRDSHLEGSILYGNTSIGGAVKKAVENKQDFSGLLKKKPKCADIWKALSD